MLLLKPSWLADSKLVVYMTIIHSVQGIFTVTKYNVSRFILKRNLPSRLINIWKPFRTWLRIFRDIQIRSSLLNLASWGGGAGGVWSYSVLPPPIPLPGSDPLLSLPSEGHAHKQSCMHILSIMHVSNFTYIHRSIFTKVARNWGVRFEFVGHTARPFKFYLKVVSSKI